MTFDLHQSIDLLSRTPSVLKSLLRDLPREWLQNNEGKDTWSPYDIVGHLIHGEKTDWMPRAKLILSDSQDKTFEPFDRFAQLTENQEKPIEELLDEFKQLRAGNLEQLRTLSIDESHLAATGIHPELGEASLQQLLSTWVVHDLGHIAQISRVMAKQYQSEVGPWKAYLSILRR